MHLRSQQRSETHDIQIARFSFWDRISVAQGEASATSP
jgi:hypothetical protein